MKSPCVKKCNITPDSQYCKGCKRTITEITNWTKFSEEQKKNIMLMLRHRNIYRDRYE